MNFLSTDGKDLCTLPWNDIIGYAACGGGAFA